MRSFGAGPDHPHSTDGGSEGLERQQGEGGSGPLPTDPFPSGPYPRGFSMLVAVRRCDFSDVQDNDRVSLWTNEVVLPRECVSGEVDGRSRFHDTEHDSYYSHGNSPYSKL